MDKQLIDKVIKKSKVIVQPGRFAYVKLFDKHLGNHFMISQDKDEITAITEEKNLNIIKPDDVVKWFKLIEIQVAVPFLKGFLSRTIKPIAEKGHNTLIVSTFSKDYILTREETYLEVVQILKKTGFRVIIHQ